MSRWLMFLRFITRRGYRVKGAARLCEMLRLHYIREPREFLLTDFDRDLLMRVDLSCHTGSQVFWRGSYSSDELHALGNLLSQDSVFLDIGANLGVFTLFAAKRTPLGQVWAFEPVTAVFNKLSANVQLNKFSRVHLIKSALSDTEQQRDIHIPTLPFKDGSFNEGISSFFRNLDQGRQESVRVTTLDRFVEQEGLQRIDIMKIDVEGSELSALCGAKQTLSRFHPKIIVEINAETSSMAGYESREILNYLQQFGYTFQSIRHGGKLSPIDTSTLSEFQNILCLPKT